MLHIINVEDARRTFSSDPVDAVCVCVMFFDNTVTGNHPFHPRGRIVRLRNSTTLAAGLVLVPGVSSPAFADGSTFDGHATSKGESFVDYGEYQDTDSDLRWKDAGKGKSGTWIKFTDCSFSAQWRGNPEPRVQLRRERPGIIPDEPRKTKNYANCANASSANFGSQPSGNYHFDVQDVDVALSTVRTLRISQVQADY